MAEVGPAVAGLDTGVLTPVVRRALGDDAAEVEDWTAAALMAGSTMAAGVYRLSGTARSRGGAVHWSVVLKMVAADAEPAALDPTQAAYWRREPLVFQSGLLDNLPGGLAGPRCFGLVERAGGVWLWLEDVAEAPGTVWPIERYALAARHLGAFAGASLVDQPPPDVPWLTRGIIRSRVEGRAGEVAKLAAARDEPVVRRFWPGDMVDRFVRLAGQRHALLDALDLLPQVLQHGDAGRKNLFARRRAGRDETVAIDWAWLGLGALGEEAATLAASSVLWFQVDTADADELEQACLVGYLDGVHDAGWRGDPALVRLGMAAALALRFAFVPILELWPRERWPALAAAFGRPAEDGLERVAFVRRRALDRADTALALLDAR